MTVVTFYIRHILDAFRNTSRIIKHFNLVKLNGIIVIPKLFFIRLFYSFSFIRNFSKPNKDKNTIQNDYFNEPIDLYKCIDDIDRNGYSETFNLKDTYQNDILNEVLKCKTLDLKKLEYSADEIIKKENENLNDYFDRLKKMEISRVSGFIDLKENTKLKRFLTSNEILKVVKSYLNTKQVSLSAAFFISNPVKITEQQKYQNAQYFHWDNDFTKFLKLYIYLNDVDFNSGPHVFIKGTHKKKHSLHKLCRLFSDSNIYENYPNNSVKKFIGKSGSTFFADSYGIHKGEEPTKKSRILLNIHYGSNKILYTRGDVSIKI